MKLYSGPLSLFTAKARIALAEKALPYQRIEVGWSLSDRYLPHHPEVVALNARRTVPVLVDGAAVVTDSTLILEYLDEAYPEPPLFPRGAVARARCRGFEDLADTDVFPAIWSLIEERFYPSGGDVRDEQRAADAVAELDTHVARLDSELVGREYLCDAFSVADIAIFVFLNAASTLGAPPAAHHENVHAWLGRMRGRPCVAEESAEMLAFVQRVMSGAPAQASAQS